MMSLHPVEQTPAVLERIHQTMKLKQGPLGSLFRIEFRKRNKPDSPYLTTLWLAYNPETLIMRVFYNRDNNDISTANLMYLETLQVTPVNVNSLSYRFGGYKQRHVMARFKSNYEREMVKQAFRSVIRQFH